MLKSWSWREESNLQPAVYKTAALPIELRQHPNDLKELQFYRLSALGSSVLSPFSWRLRPVQTERGGQALRPLRKHAGADVLELRVIFDVESKGGRASFHAW